MGWLEHTGQVSIEISTKCDMSHLHAECPLNHIPASMMPSDTVLKILAELGANEYTGNIAFSRYGEPGTDPRLWSFIAMAKSRVPRAGITITTNGRFLSPSIIMELEELGVVKIHVSLYGNTLQQRKIKEVLDGIAERLTTMQLEAPLPVNGHAHKPLIDIYTREEREEPYVPCYQPLADISIDVLGHVTLCCLDWKSRNCLGTISNDSLESVIDSSVVRTAFEQLSNGTRLRGICQRCGSSREQR